MIFVDVVWIGVVVVLVEMWSVHQVEVMFGRI